VELGLNLRAGIWGYSTLVQYRR